MSASDIEYLLLKKNCMKTCVECGKSFNGRADKKYCSDECRAAFNDRIYRERRRGVASINNILRRNYTVLKELEDSGILKTDIHLLLGRGFDFNHFTSIEGRCDENGSIWIGCYSYSYSIDSDGTVILRNSSV